MMIMGPGQREDDDRRWRWWRRRAAYEKLAGVVDMLEVVVGGLEVVVGGLEVVVRRTGRQSGGPGKVLRQQSTHSCR